VAEEAALNAAESARCSENKHDESKAKQKKEEMRKYLTCSENEQKSTIEEVTLLPKANEDMRTSIVLPCTCYMYTASLPSMMTMTMPCGWLMHEPTAPA